MEYIVVDGALPVTINTLEEQARREDDILVRIHRFPNGGNLFMAHPFLLLADLGVRIGDDLRAELVRQNNYPAPDRLLNHFITLATSNHPKAPEALLESLLAHGSSTHRALLSGAAKHVGKVKSAKRIKSIS